MKKLVLGTFVVAMSGCVTEVDYVNTAHWDLESIAFNAAGNDTVLSPATCPPGFDTAAVVSQASDASGNPIGSCAPNTPSGTCFVDLYNCADGTGTTTLPGGNYLQWIAITNHDGSQIFATTPSAVVDVTADRSFNAQILVDGGYFAADWQLTAGGAPTTCATAGADGVSVDSTVSGASAAVADTFTCADQSGITAGIPQGAYTVSMQALNGQMQALGPATVINSSIQDGNAITDLGTVMIETQ